MRTNGPSDPDRGIHEILDSAGISCSLAADSAARNEIPDLARNVLRVQARIFHPDQGGLESTTHLFSQAAELLRDPRIDRLGELSGAEMTQPLEIDRERRAVVESRNAVSDAALMLLRAAADRVRGQGFPAVLSGHVLEFEDLVERTSSIVAEMRRMRSAISHENMQIRESPKLFRIREIHGEIERRFCERWESALAVSTFAARRPDRWVEICASAELQRAAHSQPDYDRHGGGLGILQTLADSDSLDLLVWAKKIARGAISGRWIETRKLVPGLAPLCSGLFEGGDLEWFGFLRNVVSRMSGAPDERHETIELLSELRGKTFGVPRFATVGEIERERVIAPVEHLLTQCGDDTRTLVKSMIGEEFELNMRTVSAFMMHPEAFESELQRWYDTDPELQRLLEGLPVKPHGPGTRDYEARVRHPAKLNVPEVGVYYGDVTDEAINRTISSRTITVRESSPGVWTARYADGRTLEISPMCFVYSPADDLPGFFKHANRESISYHQVFSTPTFKVKAIPRTETQAYVDIRLPIPRERFGYYVGRIVADRVPEISASLHFDQHLLITGVREREGTAIRVLGRLIGCRNVESEEADG